MNLTVNMMIDAITQSKPFKRSKVEVEPTCYGCLVYLYGQLIATVDNHIRELFIEPHVANVTTLKYTQALLDLFGLDITVGFYNKTKQFIFIQNDEIIAQDFILLNY